MHACLLCNTPDKLLSIYQSPKGKTYWKCQDCGFIFLSVQDRPTPEQEKARYRQHQNSVLAPDYLDFLRPVVGAVMASHGPDDQGLDFGCGPESAVSYLLRLEGYNIEDYDPLFFPREELLQKKYDYIACTEVVEHFADPRAGFETLFSLLKPGGRLYVKTSLTDDVKDFASWYYRRDLTHVGFFNRASLEYVRETFGFARVEFFRDYVLFVR